MPSEDWNPRAPSVSRLEAGVAIGTIIATGLSAVLSDALWKALAVPSTERGVFTVALSLVVLIAGFLALIYAQWRKTTDRVDSTVGRVVDTLQARIPTLCTLEVMTTRDAFVELAFAIKHSRNVWNTRIAPSMYTKRYDTPASTAYASAIVAAIRAGTNFRDVVSASWENAAKELERAVDGGDGVYRRHALQGEVPSFLNFTVLEGRDGRRVTYLGWTISHGRGFEQPTIKITEPRVAEYFIEWHADLTGGTGP